MRLTQSRSPTTKGQICHIPLKKVGAHTRSPWKSPRYDMGMAPRRPRAWGSAYCPGLGGPKASQKDAKKGRADSKATPVTMNVCVYVYTYVYVSTFRIHACKTCACIYVAVGIYAYKYPCEPEPPESASGFFDPGLVGALATRAYSRLPKVGTWI